jgi:hypothetical protein
MNEIENILKIKKCIITCETEAQVDSAVKLISLQHDLSISRHSLGQIPFLITQALCQLHTYAHTKKQALRTDPFQEMHDYAVDCYPQYMQNWYSMPTSTP